MEKGLNDIFSRYSCRNFDDKAVDKTDIEIILKAAMQAPSAGNQQPWEFIVVDDAEIIKKLCTVSPYATPCKTSKCVVVVLGNKCDLKKREVKTETAKEWAKGRGYKFYESSAKSGHNVSEAFKYLFNAMYTKTIQNRDKYLK